MADQRIQYTEEMVGANHPTKSDTLNRLSLVDHENNGGHKTVADATLSGTPVILTITDSAGNNYYIKAYPTKT